MQTLQWKPTKENLQAIEASVVAYCGRMKTVSKEALQDLTAVRDYLAKFERMRRQLNQCAGNHIVISFKVALSPFTSRIRMKNVEADQIKENDLLSGNEDVGKAEDEDDRKVELQVASKSLKRKAMQKKTQDIKKRPKAKFSTTESSAMS